MRPSFLLPLLALAAAGCEAVAEANAEDSLTSAAISGQEEELASSGMGRGNGPGLDPMRGCDARADHEALWARADIDGSGKLDNDEQDETVREHGRPPRHFHMLRWVYDTDDSGELDDAERAVLLEDHTARCDALQARLLAEFDADGNGTLDDAELEAAEAAREAARAEGGGRPEGVGGRPEGAGGRGAGRPMVGSAPPPVVDEFDADGNGTLSDEEKATARATLRERIRSGERPVAPPQAAGD